MISLDEVISYCPEYFAAYEHKVTQNLALELSKFSGSKVRDMTIMISLDETTPVAQVNGTEISLRYNGRFFPPEHKSDGGVLDIDLTEWNQVIGKWASERKYVFTGQDEVSVPIKFTLFIPTIEIPGQEEQAIPDPNDTSTEPEPEEEKSE